MSTAQVTFDKRAVVIDGKRTILYCGSYHYPKIHYEHWPQALELAKDCGLNCLEVYIFWNVHEKKKGVYHFEREGNIFRFLQLAQERGLKVILRMGPYICAETSYGGFPYWLREIPGIEFRTYNEPFMKEMKRWLTDINRMLKENKLYHQKGGPIILVQIENEYDIVSSIYGAAGQKYLHWCYELYKEGASEWLTSKDSEYFRVASIDKSIETINDFYGHRRIDSLKALKPHQPLLWTEFWIGWYNIWRGAQRQRPVDDVIYAAARFIAQGGSGMNYYMFHGGTHFGNLAMYGQTTGYDFDAPVDSYGRPTEKFERLKQLNHCLSNLEYILLSQDEPEVQKLTPNVNVYRWKDIESGDECSFVCNDQRSQSYVIVAERAVCLKPLSVKIYLNHEEVFDSSQNSYNVSQKSYHRLDYVCNEWKTMQIPIPSKEKKDKEHFEFSFPHIPDMLHITQDETDYMWYTGVGTIYCPFKGENTPHCLKIHMELEAADYVHVFLNRKYVGSCRSPCYDERFTGRRSGFSKSFDLEDFAPMQIAADKDGTYKFELAILVCSLGLIKGEFQLWENGRMEQERKGIFSHPIMCFQLLSPSGKLETVHAAFDSKWSSIPLYISKENSPSISFPITSQPRVGPQLWQAKVHLKANELQQVNIILC
ncbi:beta-galactosidase [Galdieria sulphuraria]|uniref:Beta-galactosidase n=1 Tax=Galdieria sulphuraria TaxID=130081 RepID=M2WR28_GALSU|nr:beta-galactosidase [Galdieria sulphuraria]EME26260.1 beta-galactosidase [Galdieria sulphuraria]|eukprot:XP_005702780.1 beta-galactosidase [Galdieria sulphuraria]